MEKRMTSKNGIDIYSYKSEGLHSFCICLYAKAGVLYESDRECGISHFVEHIVFRNINLLMGGRLYDTLDLLGLNFTAATYKEFMQFTVSGASARFSEGAEIIVKLFEKLEEGLREKDFEAERGRIRAEIREYDERSTLDYLVKKKVWEGTPPANMITGTLGTVGKMTLSGCERARNEIFSQGNFFFYVTGNFDDANIARLCECVERYSFEKFGERNNTCNLPINYMERKKELLHKDSAYYMVELCFDMDVVNIKKTARNLFYDLMFAGENCRFFRELSERMGYIYSYDAKIEEYRNVGNLSVSFELALKDLYSGIECALSLFNEMKKDASGLDRAKVYYTDNAYLALDNAEDFNWTMAYENHILDEKIKSVGEKSVRYAAVTEKEITDIASRVFRKSNLVIGIKGRKKKIDSERILGLTEILG